MQSSDCHDLESMAEAVIHVDSLQSMKGFDKMIERIVVENKLDLLTPETLIKLRSIILEYRNSKKK